MASNGRWDHGRLVVTGLLRSVKASRWGVLWGSLVLLGVSLGASTSSSLLATTSTHSENKEPVLDCYILEELRPRTQVDCNIVQDYGLARKFNSSVLDQLRFGFLTHLAPDKQYFSIDEEGGTIRTTRSIDRDELCPRAEECFVKFDIAVKPIQFFMIIKVRIDILDINDNSPQFPTSSISFELSETSEIGISFFIPSADDLDSRQNGVSHYNILPPNDCFELSVGNRPDGSWHLRLVLKKRLDRESVDFYHFNVVALDGGDPVRTALLQVNVTVLDANDNSPEFENVSYEVWLREDATVGAIVFRIRARDPDLGPNGEIAYNFTASTLAEYGDVFEIRPDSGNVYTRERLDFETKSIYLLYITATDGGLDEKLSSQTPLMVRIVDVNDNPPHIRVNSQPHSVHQHPEVLEGADIGSFVAHISVEDRDSGNNGKFHCFIADSKLFELKQMYPTEFKVVTMAKFDREVRDQHGFTVTCRDSGTPSLTSTLPIRVAVRDRNDHSPVFLREYYRSIVEENQPTGSSIAKVTAIDRDSGLNGQIVYSLDKESAKIATVDSTSGLVTTKISFDHENISSYELEVLASDLGEPSRSSSVRVYLIIRDVDDEVPSFQQSTYVFSILENLPPGTTVGTVKAIDKDSESFNRIVYSIDQHEKRSRFFHLDPSNGVLTLLETLDREHLSVYNLTIFAGSTEPRSRDTANVIVYVDDVNDHKPIFEFPTTNNNSVYVSGDVDSSHVIVKVSAFDLDAGLNAKLTYVLRHRDRESHAFFIDPETGQIWTNVRLKTLGVAEVTLDVTATDGGDPPLSESAQLVVKLRRDESPLRRQDQSGKLFAGSDVHTASQRDLPDDQSDPFYVLLASEDLAVVLLVLLATIVAAIAIIVAIICLARQRRRLKKYDGKFQCSSSNAEGFVPGKGFRIPADDTTIPQTIDTIEEKFDAQEAETSFTQVKKTSPNSDSTCDSGRGKSSDEGTHHSHQRPPIDPSTEVLNHQTQTSLPTNRTSVKMLDSDGKAIVKDKAKEEHFPTQGVLQSGQVSTLSSFSDVHLHQPRHQQLLSNELNHQPRDPFKEETRMRALQQSSLRRQLPTPPRSTDLRNLQCSHLDALNGPTTDFLAERTYSTLAPTYSRIIGGACFGPLTTDGLTWDRTLLRSESPEPVLGGVDGISKYLSLSRSRHDPSLPQAPSLTTYAQASRRSSRLPPDRSSGGARGMGSRSSGSLQSFESGLSDNQRRTLSPKLASRSRTADCHRTILDDHGFPCY